MDTSVVQRRAMSRRTSPSGAKPMLDGVHAARDSGSRRVRASRRARCSSRRADRQAQRRARPRIAPGARCAGRGRRGESLSRSAPSWSWPSASRGGHRHRRPRRSGRGERALSGSATCRPGWDVGRLVSRRPRVARHETEGALAAAGGGSSPRGDPTSPGGVGRRRPSPPLPLCFAAASSLARLGRARGSICRRAPPGGVVWACRVQRPGHGRAARVEWPRSSAPRPSLARVVAGPGPGDDPVIDEHREVAPGAVRIGAVARRRRGTVGRPGWSRTRTGGKRSADGPSPCGRARRQPRRHPPRPPGDRGLVRAGAVVAPCPEPTPA